MKERDGKQKSQNTDSVTPEREREREERRGGEREVSYIAIIQELQAAQRNSSKTPPSISSRLHVKHQ